MKTRRWLLLLLIMIVATMSMATSTGVTSSLFTDGEASTDDVLSIRWGLTTLTDTFDGGPWDFRWNDNGTTTWIQDIVNGRADAYSAFSDRNSNGFLTSDDFDAAGAPNIVVSFWFKGNSLVAGDFLVEIYDGATYSTMLDVATLIAVDDTWYQYAEVITASEYLISGFHLRFNTTAVGGAKDASVDDVRISTLLDVTDPTAPSGLGGTPSDSQVSLSWTANTDPDLYGYNVYRGPAGGPYSQVNGSLLTANSYVDTGLTNGITYYYVVTAIDTSTNESAYSGEASAMPADAVAPANPAGLGATPGDSQVALSWTANGEGDLAGYNVYRSTDSGGSPTAYSQVNGPVGTNSFTDLTVTNDITYYYVVRAVDTSTNQSGNSNEVSAMPVVDVTPPANPTGLGATPGDSQVALSWTANTEPDLAGYKVYRGPVAGPYVEIDTTVLSLYTDNTVTNGTTYEYVVTAVDTSTNESGNSNEASATPAVPPLLTDGFDFPAWDGNWDGNGTTSWIQDTTPVRTGSYSVTSDKSNSGLLTSDDRSTSGAVSITVSFWYYSKAIDAGDVLVKVSYDGSAWNTPWALLTLGDLTTHGGFVHNTWVFFSETIAGPYINVANFSLQFDSTGLADGGEAINIDDVLITIN